MKESLSKRILQWLQNNEGFHNGGEIERLAMSVGFKASNASRRCRELVEDGLIEKKIDRKSRSVYYKAI